MNPYGISPHPSPVLDSLGEHNISMTTNPSGFESHLHVISSDGLTPYQKSALLKGEGMTKIVLLGDSRLVIARSSSEDGRRSNPQNLKTKKWIATKIKDFLAMTKSQEVKQSTNMLNRKSGHGCP